MKSGPMIVTIKRNVKFSIFDRQFGIKLAHIADDFLTDLDTPWLKTDKAGVSKWIMIFDKLMGQTSKRKIELVCV
jgi:hypothetical protein